MHVFAAVLAVLSWTLKFVSIATSPDMAIYDLHVLCMPPTGGNPYKLHTGRTRARIQNLGPSCYKVPVLTTEPLRMSL